MEVESIKLVGGGRQGLRQLSSGERMGRLGAECGESLMFFKDFLVSS